MRNYFHFIQSEKKTIFFRVKSLENGINKEIEANIGDNLARVLKEKNIPLLFTCEMKCECGTCSIRFSSRKDFNEILIHQPIGMEESIVLKTESKTNLY